MSKTLEDFGRKDKPTQNNSTRVLKYLRTESGCDMSKLSQTQSKGSSQGQRRPVKAGLAKLEVFLSRKQPHVFSETQNTSVSAEICANFLHLSVS